MLPWVCDRTFAVTTTENVVGEHVLHVVTTPLEL